MQKACELFINKFWKIMIIGIIIMMLSALYCWPIEFNDFIYYILEIVLASLAFLFPIVVAKINNFTGATVLFSKIIPIKYMWFMISIGVFFGLVIGCISMLKTKNLEDMILLIPFIVSLYGSSKASQIYQSELNKRD